MGYCLKVFIEEGSASVNDIASTLGISRQGVYNLYGQVSLDKTYQDKIKKKGYQINGITTNGGYEIGGCDELKKELTHCKELLRSREELIDALRGSK